MVVLSCIHKSRSFAVQAYIMQLLTNYVRPFFEGFLSFFAMIYQKLSGR